MPRLRLVRADAAVVFSDDMRKPHSLVIASLFAAAACQHAPAGSHGAGGPASPAPTGSAPPPLLGHNLVYNGDFNKGARSLPWNGELSKPAEGRSYVDKGELCLEVKNRGINRWNAQLRHQHLKLLQGHTYTIQFKVRSTQKTRIYLKLGDAGPPYHEFWKLLFGAEQTPQVYSGTFKMQSPDDPGVELAFHIGGQLARLTPTPFTVCLDDVRIDDPQYAEVPEPTPPLIPNVIVNQVGYFPNLPKTATVRNPNAVPWDLLNAKGEVVAKGTTIPFGFDAASGDHVSIADFSTFAAKGTGYTLRVGQDVSHPFDIGDDIYAKLKYDALAFFYQQRSGIPIEMPYAGDPKWVRPAGHLDVKPNIGDTAVPCSAKAGCSYKLDVRGGWYDAGDHGKYVVNAGISVWTLLNWWERGQVFGGDADFADGKMNIPENKNKVPDLLDEARWELEWELRMQVPEGEKMAGMVHHKIHDAKWTALSMGPHEDPVPRFLYPISTSATLDLAANAAQAARIWRGIDRAFADRCLKAAERAWVAAKANPEMYSPTVQDDGGGPYDDNKVADNFYWAAAELYITTKKPEYKDVVTKSEFFKSVSCDSGDNPGMYTSMTWGDTQTLGSVSLAIVPNGLGKDVVAEIRKNVATVGDRLIDVVAKQGYRLPFGTPKNGYPWGSNSFVLTNALMLGLAHDFTQDPKYLAGAAAGMNYILGQNPLDQSFVTGWGDRPLENPYHRFWCHQANPKYPPPPPGVLSGGPNSGFEDPYMASAGLNGCAPQKCFIDNGEAWSANEVTINWNAPLFWVAAYLDEAAAPKAAGPKAAGAKARKK
jgi:endoglucanase